MKMLRNTNIKLIHVLSVLQIDWNMAEIINYWHLLLSKHRRSLGAPSPRQSIELAINCDSNGMYENRKSNQWWRGWSAQFSDNRKCSNCMKNIVLFRYGDDFNVGSYSILKLEYITYKRYPAISHAFDGIISNINALHPEATTNRSVLEPLNHWMREARFFKWKDVQCTDPINSIRVTCILQYIHKDTAS